MLPALTKTRRINLVLFIFYRKNKVGVDVVDQMPRHYSTYTGSRRWSFTVWTNTLNIAALNSWFIYRKVIGKKISRRDFIRNLVESLRTKYVAEQALLCPDPISNDLPSLKRRKCAVKRCVNNTKTVCHICHLHTCGNYGQASYKVTQCNTCFKLARAHQ